MKLYSYWRSTCSWRVRIALAHKNIPFDYVAVNLVRAPGAGGERGEQHGDVYRRLNPLAQVPTLEFEDDGKVRHISQSMAILEFLEELKPAPPLLPHAPFWRAKARQLAQLIASGIQPHQNLGTLQYVESTLGQDSKAWARHFMSRGLAALEVEARMTHGLCLVGDEVSHADICLVPQLYAARRYAVDLAAFGTLTRIEAHLAALPAFVAAHAEKQVDAPHLT